MQIFELLQNTIKMGQEEAFSHGWNENRREPGYTFKRKPFGTIYYDNLTMIYKGDIIELSMVMGINTERDKSAHRQAIALKGIDYEEVTETELVKEIKAKNPLLKLLDKQEVLLSVLEKRIQWLEGKIIIPKGTTERKFFIIPSKISLDTEISCLCSCSSYYYDWAWYNADHKCLLGKRPPAYKRLYFDEKGKFRTLRNPNKTPGMCKHLLLFLGLLMNGDLIQKIPDLTYNLPLSGANKVEFVTRTNVSNLLRNLRQELKEAGQTRGGFKF